MLSSYYTPRGLDPGWLGQPKPRPVGGSPQFGPPSASPYGQYSRPGYVGVGQGSYSNPGINDPTLAPGSYGSYGVGGVPSGVGGLPPGAIKPSIQWAGGGIPNYLSSAGWTVGRGPDGNNYWFPPGTSYGQANTNHTY